MKSGTENKLKFKQLMRRLDLTLWKTRGLLDTLWKFAADNCPAGDLGRFTDDEIAIGIDWRDEPRLLIETLTIIRWLDADDAHRLIVHDWPEHCEDGVHKTLARRTDVFANGSLPNLSRFTKDERKKLIKLYESRYGVEAVKIGRIHQNVSERLETPENTPALPCLALPSQALPSHTSHKNGTASKPESTEGGRVGGLVSLDEWDPIADRLAALGASRWKQTIEEATAAGCTPTNATQVIDYGEANHFGVGAILLRLRKSRQSMPIDSGWPDIPRAEKTTIEASKKRKQDRQSQSQDTQATKIIKAGNSAGKTDEETNQELKKHGLKRPK